MSQDDVEDLRAAYARISKPSEEQFMTVAEKLIQEGRAGLLLALLEQRFGALPDRVVMRVRAANSTEVDEWARRVLTASTLADVFAP